MEKREKTNKSVQSKEIIFQNEERQKRAAELIIANQELAFQNKEKEKRAAELAIANKELAYQNKEKDKRAAELAIANIELTYQNLEKEKRAAELDIANKELAYQNKEKEKRAGELSIANIELAFQNQEKQKRAEEVVIANKELAYQNKEKDKRSAELTIANLELAFQNQEKEKRAEEVVIANKELAYQNKEKDKRAAELTIANLELAYQNEEKEKRAEELFIANIELAFQNKEKDKRSAELILANIELTFQNEEKEKRAAEMVVTHNELKKAEEQFRLVVELSPYALILIDLKGCIILINHQTEKLLGYDRNDLIGNRLDILVPQRFHHEYLDPQNLFLKKSETGSLKSEQELYVIGKNGVEIAVEIDLNTIDTVEGYMILASLIDITEKKLQQATQQMQVEMEFKNKNLEQFAYLASHDLQAPLRNVSGLIQLFETKYLENLDDSAKEYIHAVNNSTKRMSKLIESILEFSLLGRNTKSSRVDCNKIIEGVLADLKTLINNSNAIIEVKEMPTLIVYEFQIRQIFQNLLTNALKFSRKDTSPRIIISSEKIDKKWRFSVSDNGIGIASPNFDKVFNFFERLHSHNEYEGSGIGLANCKKIAQIHNGEIWIESTVGEGSTFHFTIGNLTTIN